MKQLELKNIQKIYPGGVQAVYDFNLDIDNGEFIVLVGPSGCGKSTVLRMISGLEGISSGEFYMDGKLVNNLPPVERDVSMVFQDYSLYGNMTVYDNVGMSLRVRHRSPDEIFDKVIKTADFLQIREYLNRYPGQLSGGQKQRVALGRSVAREPKVFLMDEPLSNLDAKLRTHTRTEIARLQRDLGVTTIYVTHDQIEAMTMADRIVVMCQGRIQQIGKPMDIFNNPENIFVAGFIGMPPMNFLHGRLDGNRFIFKDQSLEIPSCRMKALAGYDGKDVTMGARAEMISLANQPSSTTMKAEYYTQEYLGSSFDLFYRMDNTLVQVSSLVAAHSGEKFHNLSFDMDKVHFFDQETTKRIR